MAAEARDGYDDGFLGVTVPLPALRSADTVTLPFTHFTVVLHPRRRLAVATAANLDGSALVEIERGDDWHLDPRRPAREQTGPEVYAGNDLDRGHLVRRRDPVWGDPATAAQANFDTFCFVNAAPQAAGFNQGENLWLGLEDYLLEHARAFRQRLAVFTAPVLADDDPPYRGIRIPRRFWKIAAWTAGDYRGTRLLAATGYVLDQTPQLDVEAGDVRARLAGDPPPLGPFRTFQVPIDDIVSLTGLDLGPLPAADRYTPSAAPAPRGELSPSPTRRWTLLTTYAAITL